MQADLTRCSMAVAPSECRFLETVELLDGRIMAGEADLRGFEDAFLGGERVWGRRVVEISPVSAWLSAHLASRAGDYVALELPAGLDGRGGWEPLRQGWRFVMDALGLEAPVVCADQDLLPESIGSFDVAALPCVLSRSADPLLTLRRAAELSDDTLIVTEHVSAEIEQVAEDAGSAVIAVLPEPRLPAGPRWALSIPALGRLLERLGFDRQVVTRFEPRRLGQTARYVSIVARRPTPRPARAPTYAAPAVSQVAPQPAPAGLAAPLAAAATPAAASLPLPSAEERRLAIGTEDAEAYLTMGRVALADMQAMLKRAGADPAGPRRVLDFGCGLGRVLRHWHDVPGAELHGTDIDAAAILWNRENLGYGVFAMNTLDPRLPYPDGHFDFVYAIAVFNHLPEELQRPWARELLRVLRPGGYLYFTTFAASRIALLSPGLQRAMDAGQLVVNGAERAGTDDYLAFHSPEWVVREMLMPAGAVLAEYAAGGLDHPPQDCWLWKKP
jgi:SAM-dependent methyltransferase